QGAPVRAPGLGAVLLCGRRDRRAGLQACGVCVHRALGARAGIAGFGAVPARAPPPPLVPVAWLAHDRDRAWRGRLVHAAPGPGHRPDSGEATRHRDHVATHGHAYAVCAGRGAPRHHPRLWRLPRGPGRDLLRRTRRARTGTAGCP
ncbi:hypothetical protein OY671_011994, partial [Metschnikowia pulcherrima]